MFRSCTSALLRLGLQDRQTAVFVLPGGGQGAAGAAGAGLLEVQCTSQ